MSGKTEEAPSQNKGLEPLIFDNNYCPVAKLERQRIVNPPTRRFDSCPDSHFDVGEKFNGWNARL